MTTPSSEDDGFSGQHLLVLPPATAPSGPASQKGLDQAFGQSRLDAFVTTPVSGGPLEGPACPAVVGNDG